MSSAPVMPVVSEGQNSQLPNTSSLKKWSILAVLSLALAIIIIDSTLLNVSLSTLIRELHTDIQSLQWVITAYALALSALTITGGRLGDIFGRKKMFMLGAVIFALGSFLASVSTNVTTMLWGESIIEGIGAALMMPATASLVVANFRGRDRAVAFGVWGGIAGASSAIGPLLGGYLTTHFSWRWGFRINVFVAALVLLGSVLIRESKDENKRISLDIPGVLLSALGLLSVVFGVIESSTYGWWTAKQAFMISGQALPLFGLSVTPVAVLLGFLILALFVWWELHVEARGKTPLVSMKLFSNSQFTSGTVTTGIMSLGLTGMVFALPVFFEAVKSYDAFRTGLALLPLSGGLLVMAPLTAFLTRKIPPKRLIQAGLLLTVIATLIERATLSPDASVIGFVPGLLLFGLGMGAVMAPISNLTLSAVPVEQAGEASGVNNTLRQVGASLGAAIIGAALLTSLSGSLSTGIAQSSIIPQPLKQQIIQKLASPSSDAEFGVDQSTLAQLPPPVATELQRLVAEATTEANKDSLVYAAMFLLMGLAASFFLPHPEDEMSRESGESKKLTTHHRWRFGAAAAVVVLAIFGGVDLLRNPSPAAAADTSQAQTADAPTLPYRVIAVERADLIAVEKDGQVSMVAVLGLHAPVWGEQGQPMECYAVVSQQRAARALLGKTVDLKPDPTQVPQDIFGRLNRYVILPDGTNYDQWVLAQGLAYENSTNPQKPYQLEGEFQAAQKIAETNGVGLWAIAACGQAFSAAASSPDSSVFSPN